MAEFLHCSPETITLLNGYTPIQNDFGIKKNNKNKFFLKKNENFCALGEKNDRIGLQIVIFRR